MKNEISIIESTPIASEVLSKQVADFVDQYRLCITKTARSILELANVVNDAKKTLSSAEFQSFRNAIGADKRKESYIHKLSVIANQYARFEKIVDRLPASYTTLYDLAKMNEDEFQSVEVSLSPATTANNILQILSSKKPVQQGQVTKTSSSQKSVLSIVIDTSGVSVATLRIICEDINKICDKYSLPSPQVSV